MGFWEGFGCFLVVIVSLVLLGAALLGLGFFGMTNPKMLWWYIPVAVILLGAWFGFVSTLM